MQNNQENQADKSQKTSYQKNGKTETSSQQTQFGQDNKSQANPPTTQYGQSSSRPADSQTDNNKQKSSVGQMSTQASTGIQNTAGAQTSGGQVPLEQFVGFIKSNWRVILAELAAAAVGAYLKHSSTNKKESDKFAKADMSQTH